MAGLAVQALSRDAFRPRVARRPVYRCGLPWPISSGGYRESVGHPGSGRRSRVRRRGCQHVRRRRCVILFLCEQGFQAPSSLYGHIGQPIQYTSRGSLHIIGARHFDLQEQLDLVVPSSEPGQECRGANLLELVGIPSSKFAGVVGRGRQGDRVARHAHPDTATTLKQQTRAHYPRHQGASRIGELLEYVVMVVVVDTAMGSVPLRLASCAEGTWADRFLVLLKVLPFMD